MISFRSWWSLIHLVSTHNVDLLISLECNEHFCIFQVELVFTRTLTSLCDQSNHRQTQFRPIKTGYTLPVFTGGEYPIWGFTAIVLHQVLTVLAPGLYSNKLKHRRWRKSNLVFIVSLHKLWFCSLNMCKTGIN